VAKNTGEVSRVKKESQANPRVYWEVISVRLNIEQPGKIAKKRPFQLDGRKFKLLRE